MDAMHMVSTGVAGATFVVAATGGDRIVRALGGAQARTATVIAAGALTLGNAVSLLPGAPRWYSLALLGLTTVAVMWVALRVAAAPAPARPVHVVRTATTRPAARPRQATRTTPLYSAAPVGVVDAEIVADAAPAPVASINRGRARTTVTADDLHALGPVGSRATVGTGRYVAANVTQLAARRAARSEFGMRRHGLPTTDTDLSRRLRILRAYGASAPLRGRLRDERA